MANKENKTVIPFEIKAEDITNEGRFIGLGSTFGGKPDDGGDIIKFGAFKKTIEAGGRNENGIAMLSQHGHFDLNPVGIWESLIEMPKGLKVQGLLALQDGGTQLAKETHILMKMGALKGLSIGFDIPRDENFEPLPGTVEIRTRNGKRQRILKELILWEISPVTFPMNRGATITNVKDFTNCKTAREFENTLRESGLSKNSAQYVVMLCRDKLSDSAPKNEMVGVMNTMLAELKSTHDLIRR